MNLSLTYHEHVFNIYHHNEVVNEESIDTLYNKFTQLAGGTHFTFPVFYIIDYTRSQYICLTNNVDFITGYDTREFLQGEGGAGRMVEILQRDDYRIYNQNVFSCNAAFLKKTIQADHNKYVFSFNYRFVRKDKQISHVWQSGTYITSAETGLPLYNIGVVLDITAIKRDTLISHTIEKVEEHDNRKYKTLVESNFFYPYEEDTVLTRQEKNVVGYLADGFSSKQVADKLKISGNTIANHRQNMLRKTNTKNVAELVAFAIRSRII
jgi:DNA-binding CsgD family transcriptional regulator